MTVDMLVFLVVLAVFVNSSIAVSNEDLQSYTNDIVAEYKVKLRKNALQNHGNRRKRSVTINDFQVGSNSTLVYESQITEIIPYGNVPTVHPVEIEPFRIDSTEYLAVVNYKDENNNYEAKSAIFKLNKTSEGFVKVQDFSTSGGIDFEYVDTGHQKYAIFLDYVGIERGAKTNRRWFQLNQFLPERNHVQPFHYRSKVLALGAKRVKVFMKNGYYFFLTANSFLEEGGQYRVKSTMHMKVPHGFKVVQQFDTMGAQDVEVAVINGVRYVFFVNHQDNTGNTNIYSYVYKEKEQHELTHLDNYAPFGLYQRILTHGGRDFEVFSFQNNYYLVAVNEFVKVSAFSSSGTDAYTHIYDVDSVIYWWTGKIWVEWQRIPTHGAKKATYFTSEYGDPMLVIANSKAQATIYTYDYINGMFKPTAVQGLNPFPGNNTFIPDVRSVSVFTAMNETFMAVANYDLASRSGYNIFKIKFQRNATESSVQSMPDMVKNLLSQMKEELNDVKSQLDSLLHGVTEGVLTKSYDQRIENLNIHGQTNIKHLSTAHMLYTDDVTPNPVKKMAEELALLKKQLKIHELKMMELKNKLEDTVLIDTSAEITGTKTFTQGINFTSNLNTNHTQLNGTLNGIDIIKFNQSVLKINEEQTLTGKYQFNGVTEFGDHLHVTSLINNISTTDILTTNTEQEITAPKTLHDDVIAMNSDLDLKQFTINNISTDSLLLKNSEQVITGKKTYTSATFENVFVNGLIDGVNVTDFVRDKVSISGNDVINGHVTFTNGFHVYSGVSVGGLVDGVDLEAISLDDDIQNEIINNTKKFEHIYVIGHCTLNSTINGNSIENLARVNEENIFTEHVTFAENININGDVHVSGLINGLDFEKDLVTSDKTQQEMSGLKSFEQVNVDGNVQVNRDINSVYFTEWSQNVVTLDVNKPITGRKIFKSMDTQNLGIELLNNIHFDNLTESIFQLQDHQTVDMQVNFDKVVVEKELKLDGSINGYMIPDDFILMDEDQIVHGAISFTSNQTISNVDSIDFLNNQDFSDFVDDAVGTKESEVVYSEVIFENEVDISNNLIVDMINDIDMSKVATLSTYQNITGSWILASDTLFDTTVYTNNVIVEGLVNGIDISVMENEALYKNRNQTINKRIIFVEGIDCKQNLSVAGLINGVNLTELLSSSVRISKPQNITGSKTFMKAFTLQDTLATDGTINGVTLQELNENVLKSSSPQTITGNATFGSHLNVEDVANASSINHVNLQQFLNNQAAVATNGTIYIDGSLQMNSAFIKNILTEKINNISMTNILIQGTNQTLTENVIFKNVSAENILTETINNVDLSDVARKALKVTGNQNITGKYTFTGLAVTNDLNVNVLNNIDVEKLLERAISVIGDETITGKVSFTDIVTTKELSSTHLINNVNISILMEDILLKQGTVQDVCHKIEFNNLLEVDKAIFADIEKNSFINNVNISYINKYGVRLYVPQILFGDYQFQDLIAGDVQLSTLNKLDLQSDLISAKKNDTINKNITFLSPVTFNGNLEVAKLIDGVKITELAQNRIAYNDNVTFTGNKQFNHVVANKVELTDSATINYILPDDLVIINSSDTLTINDQKYFHNLVVDNLDSTSGIVNGVDLVHFNQTYMKTTDLSHTLVGYQVFHKNLTIVGNLTVEKLINNQRVSSQHNYSDNVGDYIQKELGALSSKASALSSKLEALKLLTATGTYLAGVKLSLTIDLPSSSLGALDSTIINGSRFISIARAEGYGCGDAYVLECLVFPKCHVLQKFKTNAEHLEFFIHNDQPAVLVANFPSADNITNECNNASEIYTWSLTERLFTTAQTVNEELLNTGDAPVMESKFLLKKSMQDKLDKQGNGNLRLRRSVDADQNIQRRSVGNNGNNGRNNSRHMVTDVTSFSNGKNKFVLTSTSMGSSGYVEVFRGVGSARVGELKRSQRIKVNSQRKNYLSVGNLKGEPILSISSSYGKDMKLYRKNPKTNQFEYYQDLPQSATSAKFQTIKSTDYVMYASPESGFGLCPWLGTSGYRDCEQLQSTDNRYVEVIATKDGGVHAILGKSDRIDIYEIII